MFRQMVRQFPFGFCFEVTFSAHTANELFRMPKIARKRQKTPENAEKRQFKAPDNSNKAGDDFRGPKTLKMCQKLLVLKKMLQAHITPL